MNAAARICLGPPLLLALALGGCGVVHVPHLPLLGSSSEAAGGRRLVVTIAPDANQNSPVAVDLVLVTNDKLLKLLQKLPVADWFQHRAEWELDNPKTLVVRSWQWIPGQTVAPIPLPLPGGVRGALVFANYNAPGALPVLVNPGPGLVLNLLTDGIGVHPAG